MISLGVLIPQAPSKRADPYSAMGIGIFLALVEILKHVPLIIQPGPYWSGWFSEGLIFGLILSGIAGAGAALLALKE